MLLTHCHSLGIFLGQSSLILFGSGYLFASIQTLERQVWLKGEPVWGSVGEDEPLLCMRDRRSICKAA